ncbi:hypothetical protein M2244_004212 [Rhodoferax antarcticus]|nr:hypothetical protein [Rhodoferax antarcticus]
MIEQEAKEPSDPETAPQVAVSTADSRLYVGLNHHLVLDPEDGGDAKAGPRLAELLRRVDIYTAKLSRRVSRESVTPAMAARDACLGASGHPDGIGATLLKVVGLYPPGTFVELANGETAVVIKRGEKAHTPIVASLRREDGGLLTQPERRDTLRAGLTVRKGVEPSRVRVSFDHRRVLACVAASSVRPWRVRFKERASPAAFLASEWC